jgi:hypothetical protein
MEMGIRLSFVKTSEFKGGGGGGGEPPHNLPRLFVQNTGWVKIGIS